jgi:hypothetical protein
MYENTVEYFTRVIHKRYPDSRPTRNDNPKTKCQDPNHFLWMMKQLKNMSNREKAGRWIGYVACGLECLGEITSGDSRKIIKSDTRGEN